MKFYTVEEKHKSIFKTFAIYYICMAVFCILRIISSKGIMAGAWGDFAFTFVVQVLTLFLLPLFLNCVFLEVRPKQVFKSCNFEKINIQTILISFMLGILCFFINVAVSSLFTGILTFTGYRYPGYSAVESNYSIGNFFLQVFTVACLPAFCEEFLHRGIVLQGIKHIGFKKAIVISSLLFGLLHFNIGQVAYAFVIGLILGFVAVVSKNIFPAMIIHFTNNFISVYLEFAEARGWAFGDILSKLQSALSSSTGVWVFIGTAIFMIVVVALLCLFIWLLYKQSMLRKVHRVIQEVYYSPNLDNDTHIVIDKENEIKDLLENNTLLNLTYKKMDNPIDIVLPKEKYRYKAKPTDKLFMWTSIILGGLVTLFTYIWGLL